MCLLHLCLGHIHLSGVLLWPPNPKMADSGWFQGHNSGTEHPIELGLISIERAHQKAPKSFTLENVSLKTTMLWPSIAKNRPFRSHISGSRMNFKNQKNWFGEETERHTCTKFQLNRFSRNVLQACYSQKKQRRRNL